MSKRSIGIFFGVTIYLFAGIPLCWAQTKPPLTDEDKTRMVEEMFTSPYTEEMYYRTDELLLTATGSLLPVHKAPSVASIITSEEIENIGATTLDEVLETVPGLHVVPSDLNRLDSIYSIRGIHTSINPQVLMLINGLPVTQLFSGGRPFTFRMPVSNISRVEVIRGPGSAVYGADAFAGVINIITKDRFEVENLKTGLRIDSFDTYATWMQIGGNISGWDSAFSIEYQTSNGDKDRIIESDFQSIIGPSVSNTPTSLDTEYNILDTHLNLSKGNFTARLWGWLQDDAGIGTGVTNVISHNNSQNVNNYLVDLTYRDKKFTNNLDFSVRLSYLYRKEDSYLELFTPGTVLPIGIDGNIGVPTDPLVLFTDGVIGHPKIIDEQSAIDFTTIYSGINRNRIRFGIGYKYLEENTEESKNFGPGVIDGSSLIPQPGVNNIVDGTLTDVTDTSNIAMEDQYRRLFYTSIQDEWSFARKWELTAGIRYDHYSDFGDTFNPRLALVWETRYDLTTKLIYGQAFRPPSFLELYAKNNPSTVGNPNLEPETIETFEIAFDYQPTLRLRSQLNVFYYEIEDLIEFVPATSGLEAQNTKDQNGYGFELEAKWEVTDDFTLKGNGAFQRSKDDTTKETIPDAPKLQFYLNANWKFLPQWSVDAQIYWIGDRHRTSGDVREEIDDYTLTNLVVRKKDIIKNWDISFVAKNIFDEDIREPSSSTIPNDIPMEGRSVYGEIRFQF